ncbi:Aspartate carbamoyltransferase regulatory chain [Caloramator mitchellensis]|uniref:Aspartate carbamoyltransferase regulatory chain n=1 Tax=Caloramator mitchellensis TaxID=908809 RepID=A0A0R3JYD7_CALMK|nr:aspartate carbamoyltransferase regulatory subunit [Caloramator mitchellensis]KRQ86238.1 Aspartate carbamoyltransferase regulatory chain [Caloramator mitchellensis]
MLTVNSIKNGVVIDHIKAGLGIKIFKMLELDKIESAVCLLMNVSSEKLGKKDIIKIENVVDLDFRILGILDPNITINVIKDEVLVEKKKFELPERVENVLSCKNPRCVTSIEKYIDHVFYLVDKEKGEYRCMYCDEIYALSEV